MLKRLEFHAVGPAPKMLIAFGPRLDLIAGDNGLGKSFLLSLKSLKQSGEMVELLHWR